MHAKPDLRVKLNPMVTVSGSVIFDVIQLNPSDYYRWPSLCELVA